MISDILGLFMIFAGSFTAFVIEVEFAIFEIDPQRSYGFKTNKMTNKVSN